MANDPIKIEGLTEFQKALRAATADKTGEQAVKAANKKTGDFVEKMAQRLARGKMEKKAAASLKSSQAMAAVRVIGGNQNVPYFAGANFGAYRNKIRLIKAPRPRQGGKQVRTRATMVRSDENFRKVAQRVEAQSVDTRGRLVTRGFGEQRVRLARTSKGEIRKIMGWNQFGKDEWKKDKDRFLYRAIKDNFDEIVEFYFAALDEANRKVFPD